MPSSPKPGLQEIDPPGWLGIDFGTSNSHFAWCEASPFNGQTVPAAKTILLGDEDAPFTAVLRLLSGSEDGRVIAHGRGALEEWASSDEETRRGYRFATGFKPDLAWSETARADALAFLRWGTGHVRAARLAPSIG